MNLKSLDRPLIHRDLLAHLSRSLSEEERSKVISVGNFSSNRLWIIEFHPSLNAANLLDRPVLIENRQFKFEDPNKFTIDDGKKSATLRFHFLPANITDQTITRFINNLKLKDLQIKEISNEKFKDEGWTEVTNGIKRVRISYPIDIDEQVQNLVGPTTVFGLKTNITISGQKQRCFFCLDPNHTIKNCPVKNLECTNCKMKGHPAIKCSMAEKIKSMERDKIDYNDLAVDDDLPPLAYPEDGDNLEENNQTEHHTLDSFIETFEPRLDTAAQWPPAHAALPFQLPALPQYTTQPRTSNRNKTPASKPQPNKLSTPIPPPGIFDMNTQISTSHESNYESNNESKTSTTTPKLKLKQRVKRSPTALANSKKKALKSTSSIDDNAFYDTNEDPYRKQ